MSLFNVITIPTSIWEYILHRKLTGGGGGGETAKVGTAKVGSSTVA